MKLLRRSKWRSDKKQRIFENKKRKSIRKRILWIINLDSFNLRFRIWSRTLRRSEEKPKRSKTKFNQMIKKLSKMRNNWWKPKMKRRNNKIYLRKFRKNLQKLIRCWLAESMIRPKQSKCWDNCKIERTTWTNPNMNPEIKVEYSRSSRQLKREVLLKDFMDDLEILVASTNSMTLQFLQLANNWNSWLSKPLRTLNNASIISSKMPLAEHHSLCWKKWRWMSLRGWSLLRHRRTLKDCLIWSNRRMKSFWMLFILPSRILWLQLTSK